MASIEAAFALPERSVRRSHEHTFVHPKRAPGETRALVAELIDVGLPYSEIASRIGVSRPTVCYHARRLGIPADDKLA